MTSTPRQRPRDFEIISRETIYQGVFSVARIRLRYRLFDGGWSRQVTRELFVRGAAVGVLLYDPWHRLVGLVEQFRVGALDEAGGPWLLEVVAGIVDTDETLEEVARRETFEEAGIAELVLEPICAYLTSPGGSNEKMQLFCGLVDLRGHGGSFGLAHENEDILFRVLPEADAFAALAEGRCNNAGIVISLQWLQLNLARLQNFSTKSKR